MARNTSQAQVDKAKTDFVKEQAKERELERTEKAALKKKAASGELMSVDVLPKATSNTQRSPRPMRWVTPSPSHLAAAALHGWKEHAHHENGPMMLTKDDYLAALAAINGDERGKLTPHKPALSKHCNLFRGSQA